MLLVPERIGKSRPTDMVALALDKCGIKKVVIRPVFDHFLVTAGWAYPVPDVGEDPRPLRHVKHMPSPALLEYAY